MSSKRMGGSWSPELAAERPGTPGLCSLWLFGYFPISVNPVLNPCVARCCSGAEQQNPWGPDPVPDKHRHLAQPKWQRRTRVSALPSSSKRG